MSALLSSRLPCQACPSSDAMSEYEDNYFCFSCHTWFPKDRNKVSVRVREKVNSGSAQTVALPIDFTLDIPTAILHELSKCWFSPARLRYEGIGWSETSPIFSKRLNKIVNTGRRLILPVYNDTGSLLAWEGKSFDNRLKYVHAGDKSPVVWKGESDSYCDTLVIVEDLLSAYRLKQLTNVGCLRGSAATQGAALRFMVGKYKHIIIWTDSDTAGINCGRRLHELLDGICVLGTSITDISGLGYSDPKCYCAQFLTEVLETVPYV